MEFMFRVGVYCMKNYGQVELLANYISATWSSSKIDWKQNMFWSIESFCNVNDSWIQVICIL